MPKVGDKKFVYTPAGIAAAKAEANKTGEDMKSVDAMKRSESYQLGGLVPGQPGFGVKPVIDSDNEYINEPAPVIDSENEFINRPVGMYEKGDLVPEKKKKKEVKKNIIKGGKKRKLWADKRLSEQLAKIGITRDTVTTDRGGNIIMIKKSNIIKGGKGSGKYQYDASKPETWSPAHPDIGGGKKETKVKFPKKQKKK